jgi:hypothetical protein
MASSWLDQRNPVQIGLACLGRALLVMGAAGCRDALGVNGFKVGNQVDNPCGALEVLVGDACQRAGVAHCGTGFDDDGRGGCTPILPPEPCPAGAPAHIGEKACAYLTPIQCLNTRFPTIEKPVGKVVYVDPSEAAGGDGSMDRPFASIEDAIASGSTDSASPPLSIALAAGRYATNLVLGRKVQLVGSCPDRPRPGNTPHLTTLVGSPTGATIEIGPGADGSSIEGVEITGGSTGVEVSGAHDIAITSVSIHDTAGHGIAFDDVKGAASGVVKRSLIDHAHDAGVSTYGAALTLEDTEVRNTSPTYAGGRAVGVMSGASRFFMGSDPSVRTPAQLTLTGSFIHHHAGAGVLVDVANAAIDRTVISDIGPGQLGRGAGIEARANALHRRPTMLKVTSSVIERAHDVGVRIWNADASLEDTVIRDVGADQTSRCLGNGIRARYDLLRDLDLARDQDITQRLKVSRSVIELAHQAAVHVEGGGAIVEDSILRGTLVDPCHSGFGDGLAGYASPAAAPTIDLRRTRIEGNGRAAAAAWSGNLALTDSVLECNGLGPVESGPGAISVQRSICGCENVWRPCEATRRDIAPSLLGGHGCVAGDGTACTRGCVGPVTEQGGSIPGATAWIYDHEEIASVITDDKGCYEIEGIPKNERYVAAIASETAMTGMLMGTPLADDSHTPFRSTLVPAELIELSMAAFLGPLDTSQGSLLAMSECKSPRMALEGNYCTNDQGLTMDLSPGPARGPQYENDSGFADATLTSTVSSHTFFENIPPGEHFVAYHPPPGKTMSCAPSEGGTGWPTDKPNVFKIYLEESFAVLGGELICAISDAP